MDASRDASRFLHISHPLLKIDGQDAPAEIIENLLQVLVEESIHQPGHPLGI
jgi:hypothetical protein